MHIISAEQFSSNQIKSIFSRADFFKDADTNIGKRRQLATRHQGRQLSTMFFQPSTRTRLSFETAAVKLGVGLVSTEDAREHSSSSKGETLEDTIRILNGYNHDIIVMRYFEAGGAARAAAISKAAIINAGDGRDGEHPTQALLDAYTIYKNHGRLDNLRITMGGDLLQSRCVRSLSMLLAKYKNNRITFVSVPQFQVGKDVQAQLKKAGVKFTQTSDMASAFKNSDVIYWTRLQAEYLDNKGDLPRGGLVINRSSLKHMPTSSIIMHPLPRVDEIAPSVDRDRRAKYFEQAAGGLYVRMALIDMILSGEL
ncbi:MAG TPA: aspartate carbamoyltransferase [Candidatus Saccharimonadales bacterium]|nr:aspartate carbamoyltransferase [Candidatus Saccharimonadales bacterium]